MKNTFLLYDTDPETLSRQVIIFRDPKDMIFCHNEDEIADCFQKLDKAVLDGYYAAGFLSYELGLYFQEIPFDKKSAFPLFCFGIFPSCEKVPLDKLENKLSCGKDPCGFHIQNGSYSTRLNDYSSDITRIKEHIKDGNTYQVNHTFKYKFDFGGSPLELFNHLRKTQDVPYAGFIDIDKWSILSLSPELFFRKTGSDMIVRPMKGTVKRGRSTKEDALNRKRLARSAKNKAENIMIVDLLRNDLGRISETGTVRPQELLSIEKYQTVFQMTSTIRSCLKKDMTWQNIFENIFPSGSVTGAPKKRTMEIISQTEKEERDIYTGSMGYIAPSGEAQFNVAIRTILIDKKTGKGAMGIGGGIIYDSIAEKEYSESLLKGSFLTNTDLTPAFDLIETLLWENGEYFLLDLHLKRLKKSADYFSYSFDKKIVKEALEKVSASFDPSKKYRVRLLLKKTGEVSVALSPLLQPTKNPARITVSGEKMRKDNTFLYHKTTNRTIYDREYTRCSAENFFDVIFLNTEGEVTEGAITNIMIQKQKDYWTPPISNGLLGGVYREYLLKSQELPLKEKVLYMEDLLKADKIFLINSVRKIVPAVLVR
jgi:para-aminobenzoate synthetase/4-amino-4-deoxychorismate lyase